jgi:hypothetical protein
VFEAKLKGKPEEQRHNTRWIQSYLESRSRGISFMKYLKGRRISLFTFYVETAFYNGLLKERYKLG